MACDGRSSRKAVLGPVFVRDAFFDCPALSRLYIIDLHNDVMCNIAIYADDTAHFSKSDQEFD